MEIFEFTKRWPVQPQVQEDRFCLLLTSSNRRIRSVNIISWLIDPEAAGGTTVLFVIFTGEQRCVGPQSNLVLLHHTSY